MNKTLIIGEAGVNHNGNLQIAKQMIDVAAEAGVDYVKFQTFKAEKLVSKTAKKADYQLQNTEKSFGQFEMLKKLELDEEKHRILIEYCQKKKIKFLSTAFDHDSIELLQSLGIDLFKIPSGEITNLPYLQKVASTRKPVILSTGMSNLDEIEAALNILYNNGASRENLMILHCNTEYPTPMSDVNLLAMNTIKNAFNVKVGYSDHTLGIEVPIAAVAMGATCIEKHFTLDRTMEGPDHKASLEPEELRSMVLAIRNIEKAMGNGIKEPSISEKKNIPIARKSIHISRKIFRGQILVQEDLEMKRPGNGISPMLINLVLGKQANRDLEKDHLLTFSDFN